MNLEKFTQKSQEAIFAAREIAQEFQAQAIEPAHLLLALLRQDQGVAPLIVTKIAGSSGALIDELQADLETRPHIQGSNLDIGLAQVSADVLAAAERYAQRHAGRFRLRRAPAARSDRFHRRASVSPVMD